MTTFRGRTDIIRFDSQKIILIFMIFHDFFIIFDQKRGYFFSKSRFSQGERTKNEISTQKLKSGPKFKLSWDVEFGRFSALSDQPPGL